MLSHATLQFKAHLQWSYTLKVSRQLTVALLLSRYACRPQVSREALPADRGARQGEGPTGSL